MNAGPTVVDLFSGCGGMSWGLAMCGFRLLGGVDTWDVALKVFHRSHGSAKVVNADLATLDGADLAGTLMLGSGTPDVIVGGPPCQGFSSAGQRRRGDDRNTLVGEFARLVAELRPLVFVFENVEGFLTAEGGSRVVELLEPLVQTGYRIHLRKINAANFGVPQHRKRVIAIGAFGWDPQYPEPTHSAHGAPGARLAGRHLPPTPNLGEALAGLPSASMDPPGNPEDHYYIPLEGLDLERAQALRPGQTMKHLPKVYWHDSYRRRAFRRVMDGTPTQKRGGAPAGIRRLRLDEPAKAVTGAMRNECIHPTEDRCLTVRECARLQTFPDDFRFQGSSSTRMQVIGNAVPPLLAARVGGAVLESLRSATIGAAPGALLSFIPTHSNGLSPALARVVRLVRAHFSDLVRTNYEPSLWL